MATIVTNPISRRSLLRTGSYCLALPLLDSLASAAAVSNVPKRMVFLGGGYGFTHIYSGEGESFFPSKVGRFSDIGFTDGCQ